MKFSISVIVTVLLSFAAGLYFPWWIIAAAAFLVAVAVQQKPLLSFCTGFTALFLLWGGLALYLSSANHHLLAHKVSMIILNSDSPYLLMLLTAFIGALTAGLGALSGCLLRRLI